MRKIAIRIYSEKDKAKVSESFKTAVNGFEELSKKG
jgi:hypothetical protein